MRLLKLSIIIPTFNRSRVVLRAIESIIAQNYPDIEIIVVDDGSSDNTKIVIQNIKRKCQKIIFKRLSENSGVNNARNVGLSLVSPDREAIIFLDSDDELSFNALKIINSTLSKFPRNNLFFFSSIDNKGKYFSRIIDNVEKEVSFRDYIGGNVIRGEFMGVFRKEIISDVVFEKSVSGFEDILWLRLIKKYKLVCSPAVTRIYWQDVPSLVRTSKKDRTLEYYKNTIKGKTIFLARYEKYLKKYNKKKIAVDYAVLSRAYLMVNDSTNFLSSLKKAFVNNPLEWRIFLLLTLWITKIKI